MTAEWSSVREQLPPEGRYVLVIYNGKNWRDSADPDGCYYVVAQLQWRDEWNNPSSTKWKWKDFGALSLSQSDVDYWRELPRMQIGDHMTANSVQETQTP